MPSHWPVDPDEPSALVQERVDGAYTEAGRGRPGRPLRVQAPYDLVLEVADLLR